MWVALAGMGHLCAYRVQKRVALHLRAPPAHVVDVVALQGNQVARAGEVEAPVVVSVAGCRVVGHAVEVAVGDGYAL